MRDEWTTVRIPEEQIRDILERIEHKVDTIFAKQLLLEKMQNHMHGQEALRYRSITDAINNLGK